MSPLCIDFERLFDQLAEDRERFASAEPFPHLVVDGFLKPDCLTSLVEVFPSPDAPLDWRRNDSQEAGAVTQAKKLGFSDERQLELPLRSLLWELNSGKCLRWLEQLTAIEGLISDPHMAAGDSTKACRERCLPFMRTSTSILNCCWTGR